MELLIELMEGWNERRFVILTGLISDIAVLLSDYNFWSDNADKLEQWCEDNNCQQEGMIVVFPDEKTLSLFCLQWS